MPNLFFTVGLPASGKDSYYPSCGGVHVSSDAIREEIFDDVNDQSHNSEVFNIMMKRTQKALISGKDVYYNATNLSAKRRINFLKAIANIKNVNKVCILFVTPFNVCLERNEQRYRTVPRSVMYSMLKKFTPPHKSEGWDDICIVGFQESSPNIEEYLKALTIAPHDNSHHSLTIGNHMIKAYNEYKARTENPDYTIAQSIRYHDIGKLICKTFYNRQKKLSSEAHFYNHENVSAYLFLSMIEDDYALEAANLIVHHMIFFQDEKYQQKIHNRFGDDFWKKLLTIHTFDVLGH